MGTLEMKETHRVLFLKHVGPGLNFISKWCCSEARTRISRVKAHASPREMSVRILRFISQMRSRK